MSERSKPLRRGRKRRTLATELITRYVMSQDDQEALAAQWAAQLEEEEAGQPGGDTGAPEAEAGDAGAAAGDQERSPGGRRDSGRAVGRSPGRG